jgi:SAM-dependent methyltransferase
MPEEKRPPVCDYEGSDYQARFWGTGSREYEDRCEGIAIKRLFSPGSNLLLEVGAGAGRNTLRYTGCKHIVLLDYSTTQLSQARLRLGFSDRFTYVAADIYRQPFVDGLFDTATMIRTLHHMKDAPAALHQVRQALQPGGTFILEYANKRNLKAMLRYAAGRQSWNPYTLEPIEYMPLNFDFHPRAIHKWLQTEGFEITNILTVSHFRIGLLKRSIPPTILSGLDSMLQWTGRLGQFTPSVFVKAKLEGKATGWSMIDPISFFKCMVCGHSPLSNKGSRLLCTNCKHSWNILDGIYDFRQEAL